MSVIRSRDNARVKAWSRLAADGRERREQRLALIEGVHLVEAYIGAGLAPVSLIVAETALGHPEVAKILAQAGGARFVLEDSLFRKLSDAEAPVGLAAEVVIPPADFDTASSDGCVFLDGIQDAGNVGTILRSAAAFGIQDAVLGRHCADPWSPKALRAGMGAHFSMRISTSSELASSVRRFGPGTVCTDVHAGVPIDRTDLSGRVGWVFGSEGAGVSREVSAAATRRVTVRMPGKTESLNVAACAAICFYEQARQVSKRAARG